MTLKLSAAVFGVGVISILRFVATALLFRDKGGVAVARVAQVCRALICKRIGVEASEVRIGGGLVGAPLGGVDRRAVAGGEALVRRHVRDPAPVHGEIVADFPVDIPLDERDDVLLCLRVQGLVGEIPDGGAIQVIAAGGDRRALGNRVERLVGRVPGVGDDAELHEEENSHQDVHDGAAQRHVLAAVVEVLPQDVRRGIRGGDLQHVFALEEAHVALGELAVFRLLLELRDDALADGARAIEATLLLGVHDKAGHHLQVLRVRDVDLGEQFRAFLGLVRAEPEHLAPQIDYFLQVAAEDNLVELAEAPEVRAHAVLGDVLGETVHLDGVVVHGDHVLIVLLADLVLEPVQVHGDADHQERAEEVDQHDAERSVLVGVRHGAALRLLVLVKQHRAEADARVAREFGVGRAVFDVGLTSEVEEVPQREDEEPEERGVRAEQHEPEGDAVAENLRHHRIRRADQLVLTAVALLVGVRGVARLQAAHVLLRELVLRGVGEPFLGLLPLRVLALGQLNRHLECRQILLGR